MLTSVVIIEDDVELQKYLKGVLTQENFTVKTAAKGILGLEMVNKTIPDIVILDWTLPDIDGQGVCREIRKNHPDLPIIMLTAKDSVGDKVSALNAGADDYVTKPFSIDELMARIKTRLRNTSGQKSSIKVGELELNTQTVQVTRSGKEIVLTPQEFRLLEYLMKNKGIVLSREMILNRIWMMSSDVDTRVVDVYMGYLRKKIDAGFNKPLLHSIRGFGYTIKD
jgi:DNA-binding response OmpR family regulator